VPKRSAGTNLDRLAIRTSTAASGNIENFRRRAAGYAVASRDLSFVMSVAAVNYPLSIENSRYPQGYNIHPDHQQPAHRPESGGDSAWPTESE